MSTARPSMFALCSFMVWWLLCRVPAVMLSSNIFQAVLCGLYRFHGSSRSTCVITRHAHNEQWVAVLWLQLETITSASNRQKKPLDFFRGPGNPLADSGRARSSPGSELAESTSDECLGEAEGPAKKRFKAGERLLGKSDKLEHRLGGILCCAVCLDLPRSAIYQVTWHRFVGKKIQSSALTPAGELACVCAPVTLTQLTVGSQYAISVAAAFLPGLDYVHQ
ncbi:hypothetical protein V5799_030952 [Amblyomma americanum]|uniref:Secreted protein n=1 Tax=Amblyomma americanum TaxID=6943 RepID=A0AAQ4ELQ1_AMBAM